MTLTQPKDQNQDRDRNRDGFDPDRALNTIRNLQGIEKDLKARLRHYKEHGCSPETMEARQQADQARQQTEDLKAEIRKLRIQQDATGRGLDTKRAKSAARLIDADLWATDADAAWNGLKDRTPELFAGFRNPYAPKTFSRLRNFIRI